MCTRNTHVHTQYACARAYTYTVDSAAKFAEFFRELCFLRVLTETDKYTDIDTDTDIDIDTDTDTESDTDTNSPALKLESRYNTQCNVQCNMQCNNSATHTLPTEFYRF